MSTLPKTQKAWMVTSRGQPRQVLKQQTIPIPQPPAGHVLVKVEAAALNPIGYKLMLYAPNLFIKRPRVAENDFTGVIVDGNGTQFKTGDQVFGMINGAPPDGQGSLQEFISVSAKCVALRPSNISVSQAAGLALTGQTAWQSLFDIAQVQPGQSVFINGGSTAVGAMGIQMLKAKGCTVTTSCSTKNVDFVKGLGADKVFDYTIKPLPQQLLENLPSPPFHAILDCIGNDYNLFYQSQKYLAFNGVFVVPGANIHSLADVVGEIVGLFNALFRPTWLGGVPRTFKRMFVETTPDTLQALATLAKEGKLVPPVDKVYAFEDVYAAYDRIMTSRARGKIVVTVP